MEPAQPSPSPSRWFGGAVSTGARPEPGLQEGPGQARPQTPATLSCEHPGPELPLVQGETGGLALSCSATAVAATESPGWASCFVKGGPS